MAEAAQDAYSYRIRSCGILGDRLQIEWNEIAYKPAYCETSIPAADSSVLVRKSSSEARPSQ